MIVSSLFSIAFYNVSTREVQRIIVRMQDRQQREQMGAMRVMPFPGGQFRGPNVEELQASKDSLKMNLVVINGFILLLAGGAGYFLAGRTLRPIKQMIDEQNQFISSASHELRTPIATLRAEMEGHLLEKHISDKQARQLISSNLEELSTLQALSNDLLRIAQIHNSPLGKKPASIEIDELIKTVIKKLEPLAKKKSITINTELTAVVVTGDRAMLRELLVILLDNAIKYSPENSIVTVSSQPIGNHSQIVVSDEGSGIAKQDLPHIFERFYRADKSRSQTDGFGLGLSIAKKIIEYHHGSISVQSEPDKGTIFTVELPL